jgi:hypothetical protein
MRPSYFSNGLKEEPRRLLTAVAGAATDMATYGGHVWLLLQYLLGLQRLGYEIVLLDRSHGRVEETSRRTKSGTLPLAEIMSGFGLGDRFTMTGGARGVGLTEHEAIRSANHSLLLNLNGYIRDEEILQAASVRGFLDIDPGFQQMWRELGLADVFQGHDVFVTIAENMGKPDCRIPTCGLDWITTRQPVVLDEWPVTPPARDVFTSVGSWRGPFDRVEYQGKGYGLRVHEFRKFVELPRVTGRPFEFALDIHEEDVDDLARLRENGWSLVDPIEVAGNPWRYREYIQDSKAEFMVARSMYVETRSGWFSDRSICYLASGKPVLAQDTGIKDLYPVGEGLLVFSTLEEAAKGVEEIDRDYERHSRAARAIAEEYFDSDKVLTRLLRKVAGTKQPEV